MSAKYSVLCHSLYLKHLPKAQGSSQDVVEALAGGAWLEEAGH